MANGKNIGQTKLFEIHLTGVDESIHKAAEKFDLRTIAVDLLRPNLSVLRTEHMTSYHLRFKNYEECKKQVDETVEKLQNVGTLIIRTKIESPFYREYADKALYVESHWILDSDTKDVEYPLSRSQHKIDKLLATAREYNKKAFDKFDIVWKQKALVELCLFDSFVLEDKDWFDLYRK